MSNRELRGAVFDKTPDPIRFDVIGCAAFFLCCGQSNAGTKFKVRYDTRKFQDKLLHTFVQRMACTYLLLSNLPVCCSYISTSS